jgi:hypothetical protein
VSSIVTGEEHGLTKMERAARKELRDKEKRAYRKQKVPSARVHASSTSASPS